MSQDTEDPRVAALADALAARGWDDWYVALLSACLDQAGSLDAAIGLANQLHEQHPEGP